MDKVVAILWLRSIKACEASILSVAGSASLEECWNTSSREYLLYVLTHLPIAFEGYSSASALRREMHQSNRKWSTVAIRERFSYALVEQLVQDEMSGKNIPERWVQEAVQFLIKQEKNAANSKKKRIMAYDHVDYNTLRPYTRELFACYAAPDLEEDEHIVVRRLIYDLRIIADQENLVAEFFSEVNPIRSNVLRLEFEHNIRNKIERRLAELGIDESDILQRHKDMAHAVIEKCLKPGTGLGYKYLSLATGV